MHLCNDGLWYKWKLRSKIVFEKRLPKACTRCKARLDVPGIITETHGDTVWVYRKIDMEQFGKPKEK